MNVAFIDLETTGLKPGLHQVWEIGLILRDDVGDMEYLWQVGVDLTVADPEALRVNGFYQRSIGVDLGRAGQINAPGSTEPVEDMASNLAVLLDGAFVVINNPVFDVPFLESFLRAHGQCWTRHYHVADIKSLVVGYLHGTAKAWAAANDLTSQPADIAKPWSTRKLALAVDVDPAEYDTHTALGDCRLSRAMYDAVTGGEA